VKYSQLDSLTDLNQLLTQPRGRLHHPLRAGARTWDTGPAC
jgi:hypothetical protein